MKWFCAIGGRRPEDGGTGNRKKRSGRVISICDGNRDPVAPSFPLWRNARRRPLWAPPGENMALLWWFSSVRPCVVYFFHIRFPFIFQCTNAKKMNKRIFLKNYFTWFYLKFSPSGNIAVWILIFKKNCGINLKFIWQHCDDENWISNIIELFFLKWFFIKLVRCGNAAVWI